MVITLIAAIDFDLAFPLWLQFMKIQIFALLTLVIMQGRFRINALTWVIVGSIGFYGVKGGVFSILTGSQYRIWGPPDSYIADNNALAVALLMVIPLMRYLQLQATKSWQRWAFTLAMGLCALSVLTSHSRGALLAGSAIAVTLWLKSRQKLRLGLALLALVPVLLLLMPQEWYDRMSTLRSYEEDNSAMGRVTAWEFAGDMAAGRLTGGGFGSFVQENYERFSPAIAAQIQMRDGLYQGAHSIYFQFLGEQGYFGLLLFVAVGIAAARSAKWVITNAPKRKDLQWAADLAAMLQVSMVGFAIGGAFLNLAYFDLWYHIIGLCVLVRWHVATVLNQEIPATAGSHVPMAAVANSPGSRARR